jgi:hypothetical protein
LPEGRTEFNFLRRRAIFVQQPAESISPTDVLRSEHGFRKCGF